MSNIVLSILVVSVVAALFAFVNFKFKQLASPKDDQSQKLMLQILTDLRQEFSKSQGENRKEVQHKIDQINLMMQKRDAASQHSMQAQFKESSAMIQKMTKELTAVKERTDKVGSVAEQLKGLENILKSPKQRGILGEYALETLLSNHLHGNFQMQYKMNNGEIVDAVIFVSEIIIPIDSKFSLEKFNSMTQATTPEEKDRFAKEFKSDVKKRIDETSKYIRPDEGTTEFAFMFVPAEGIYYNLTIESVGANKVNTQNLIEYAFSKRVIIVSPSSLFGYLQTVIQGLKMLKVGEDVHKFKKNLETLGKHMNAYDDYFKKLGKHLGTTVNTYNNAEREFKKIDKDVYKLTDGTIGGEIVIESIDRPQLEDGA
jgi:DNA recombination protein RmuC